MVLTKSQIVDSQRHVQLFIIDFVEQYGAVWDFCLQIFIPNKGLIECLVNFLQYVRIYVIWFDEIWCRFPSLLTRTRQCSVQNVIHVVSWLIHVKLFACQIELRKQVQHSRNVEWLWILQRTNLTNNLVSDYFLNNQCEEEADEWCYYLYVYHLTWHMFVKTLFFCTAMLLWISALMGYDVRY